GARLGETHHADNVVTITNDGLEPLSLSAIVIEEGSEEFTLSGVPADLATTPIEIPFGTSFSFGVTFSPSRLGLDRGKIRITTNDPNQPNLTAGIVGTGLGEIPTAA